MAEFFHVSRKKGVRSRVTDFPVFAFFLYSAVRLILFPRLIFC